MLWNGACISCAVDSERITPGTSRSSTGHAALSRNHDILYLDWAGVEVLGLAATETVVQIEHLCRERVHRVS